MKKIAAFLILMSIVFHANASHITGGEMFYVSKGSQNGEYQYTVTLKLLMRCSSGRQFNDPAIISFFNKSTNSRFLDVSVPLSRKEVIQLSDFNKCISDPPTVCYEVGYYEFNTSLPPSPDGYIITGQFIYRISGINNLITSSSIGATYTSEIPGTLTTPNGPSNTSAQFIGSDLVIVCAGTSFNYSFAARDQDGDELRYELCDALQGGLNGNANTSLPPAAPPYQPVPYTGIFTGGSPLGSKVTIDHATGLVTGTAPATAGIYVVTVCVSEIRNGVVIATQRKDIQINIAPCTIAGAKLQPVYMVCRDTKTLNISNLSRSPLIATQHWEFFDSKGANVYSSDALNVTCNFPDTGTYTIKLFVNRGIECTDSTTAIAKVYPGFMLDFNWAGICNKKPTIFTDATRSVYGTTDSWDWKFGEEDIAIGVSDKQNPTYTYQATGNKTVRLIAGNTFGCIDTIYKDVKIYDKPPILLAFRDTLICIKDPLQLKAIGKGKFNWSPSLNISNGTSAEPVVSPASTTTYFVDLDDDGCLNRDSVKVRVTDRVSLRGMSDTTICKGDTVRLNINSDGFRYVWSPAAQVVNVNAKNPLVVTNSETVYNVTASIGSCVASTEIRVKPVPYPVARAGDDTTVCYNTFASLRGSTDGITFNWSPALSLDDPSSLQPMVRSTTTTRYVLSAFNNLGCPKPGRDTVIIKVLPKIRAFAGRDTMVVVNQPLQMLASGGDRYQWSPASFLSASNIADPLATFTQPSGSAAYKVYVYNAANCVDSAMVNIGIFKSAPAVFVPTAFSPNGDGANEILKALPVGIRQMEYFNVYNRWGQLVFSTTSYNKGWNGNVEGKQQDPGVFAWTVKAIDYTGKPYFQKGTVMLVR